MIKKIIKYNFLLIISLTTSGCITDVVTVSDKTYSMNCTGWPMTMETCRNTARRYCPNGYTVIANSPEYVPVVTILSKAIAPSRVNYRGFVIKCN